MTYFDADKRTPYMVYHPLLHKSYPLLLLYIEVL